jgi:AraC family transcriptional regulator
MHEWNAAIAHIEAHLTDEITGAALANIALTSEYHFRRMFTTLAGMPLSEYIRNRRLTAATADILAGKSVLDTAIAYGYSSADAFTRAFKAFHGMTPTQARDPDATLKSQSQLKIHIKIEGSTNVPYRIVEKAAFHLVGYSTQVPIIHRGDNNAIAAFERSLDRDKTEALAELSDIEPLGSLSVTEYLEDDTQALYWHAVATTARPPEGTESKYVPAGQWVVFTTEGKVPEAFQQLWATAATEWFPANPYEWAPGPQLLNTELNDAGDRGTAELWIPITAK